MGLQGHLYFHSPCFDGIVSAVLAWDFLETKQGWIRIELHPVNYGLRSSWLTSSLEEPCAIVDFHFHPQAEFWADHHLTTFINEDVRKDFARRKQPTIVYDDRADSCAGLLWDHLARAFDYRNPRYEEMVRWANKIDAARYESVSEVIFPEAPALRISLGLASGSGDKYCKWLAQELRGKTLDRVASIPQVRAKYEHALSLIQTGLDRFQKAAKLESDGIVVFDVDAREAIVSRYAPYYFFPNARYSAGIIRWGEVAKITAMRNPWREFESVEIGKICEGLGGGGHRRVGSILLRAERTAEAHLLLGRLLSEIRQQENAMQEVQVR